MIDKAVVLINDLIVTLIPKYRRVFVNDVFEISNYVLSSNESNILEIPTLCGNLTKKLTKIGTVTSVDISSFSHRYASIKTFPDTFNKLHGDIRKIDINVDCYNLIVITNILYSIDNYFDVIKKLICCLQKGGYIIVSDLAPNSLSVFKTSEKMNHQVPLSVIGWLIFNTILNKIYGIKKIHKKNTIVNCLKKFGLYVYSDDIFYKYGYRIIARKIS
jgi:ubiquinone/menaquinone biosynthesis C-methylase UbiE